MKSDTLKILHISDLHFSSENSISNKTNLLSKRFIGALNLHLHRKKLFNENQKKIDAIIRFKKEHNIDLVINTGDYTALGLDSEFKSAIQSIKPLLSSPRDYVSVPGNHDIYVNTKKSHNLFEKYFKDILFSDMPKYVTDRTWPLVRLVEDNLAVVAINSAKANISPWNSSGVISKKQLDSLDAILKDKKVKDRFIMIITHYAPRLSNNTPDKKLHGLKNANEFLKVCDQVKNGAIMFGHIHKTYHLKREDKIPLYCAGSATMKDREGFWMYELTGKNLKARKFTYSSKGGVYVEAV